MSYLDLGGQAMAQRRDYYQRSLIGRCSCLDCSGNWSDRLGKGQHDEFCGWIPTRSFIRCCFIDTVTNSSFNSCFLSNSYNESSFISCFHPNTDTDSSFNSYSHPNTDTSSNHQETIHRAIARPDSRTFDFIPNHGSSNNN